MLENAERLEKILELYSESFVDYFRKGEYGQAKRVYQILRAHTTGAKLRLVGLLMKSAGVAGGAVGATQRKVIEEKAVRLTEETLAKLAFEQRKDAVIKALGIGFKRFAGPLTIAFLIKDVTDGGIAVADSIGQRMILSRIALYDDYLIEKEKSSEMASIMTYPVWLYSNYLPDQQKKRSEFFQNLRMVFPHNFIA